MSPEAGRRRPLTRAGVETAAIWGGAAALYITIGVFAVDFMLSIAVAIAYLLVTTWLVPAALRYVVARRSRP